LLSDDKSLVAVTSDIIVVALDSELTCKQLGQWHGQPALLSGGPEHQPIALRGGEFKAWGIVTHTSIIAIAEAE
jgi:DNA polymerase V